ncbi:DinB family protein [Chloroflexota bacterium]
MDTVETNRKLCLKRQTKLRRVMMGFDQFERSMDFFFSQHDMLHSAKMSGKETWSFEDAVLDDMTVEQVRRIPGNAEHSIAWIIWHIARIEDITMNILVAGSPQILLKESWLDRMNVSFSDSANEMVESTVSELSSSINIEALRAYRVSVGKRTQEIVKQLQPEQLKEKVDPLRLQKVMEEGALVESARSIADYWERRNIAGLLLMPATRHNLVHLNEALNIKRR